MHVHARHIVHAIEKNYIHRKLPLIFNLIYYYRVESNNFINIKTYNQYKNLKLSLQSCARTLNTSFILVDSDLMFIVQQWQRRWYTADHCVTLDKLGNIHMTRVIPYKNIWPESYATWTKWAKHMTRVPSYLNNTNRTWVTSYPNKSHMTLVISYLNNTHRTWVISYLNKTHMTWVISYLNKSHRTWVISYLNKTGLSCSASILWHSIGEMSGESPVRVLHSSTNTGHPQSLYQRHYLVCQSLNQMQYNEGSQWWYDIPLIPWW